MNREKYKRIIKKYQVKEKRIKNAMIVFFTGGILGFMSQLFTDIFQKMFHVNNKDANTLMIITFVFLGCFITALGVFDKLVEKFKFGLIIPITGFAHSITSSTMEYKREGFVTGMGANMFKLAGTVIMCGVVSAYFFGIIRLVIGGI